MDRNTRASTGPKQSSESNTSGSLAATTRNALLVVDDEECPRVVVGEMVRKLGFDALVAAGGLEGLELFNKESSRIAGVILDINMPGMDGVQTLAKLREICPEIKVLFVSGCEPTGGTPQTAKGPAPGFLRKPFGFQQLADALVDWLPGSERLP